jgi:hypothetical protein
MTDAATYSTPSRAPAITPSQATTPSRPRALAAPEIRIVAPLDVRQVLNINLDETMHTRVWVASPDRLVSADVVTQGLRKLQHSIRRLAETSPDGFDGIMCELRGKLGAGSAIADPKLYVQVNGRTKAIAPRRR